MTLLLAGSGAGKSSVNRRIDFIMEDIRLRDAENLKREKAWKDEMLRKCCASAFTLITSLDIGFVLSAYFA